MNIGYILEYEDIDLSPKEYVACVNCNEYITEKYEMTKKPSQCQDMRAFLEGLLLSQLQMYFPK